MNQQWQQDIYVAQIPWSQNSTDARKMDTNAPWLYILLSEWQIKQINRETTEEHYKGDPTADVWKETVLGS